MPPNLDSKRPPTMAMDPDADREPDGNTSTTSDHALPNYCAQEAPLLWSIFNFMGLKETFLIPVAEAEFSTATTSSTRIVVTARDLEGPPRSSSAAGVFSDADVFSAFLFRDARRDRDLLHQLRAGTEQESPKNIFHRAAWRKRLFRRCLFFVSLGCNACFTLVGNLGTGYSLALAGAWSLGWGVCMWATEKCMLAVCFSEFFRRQVLADFGQTRVLGAEVRATFGLRSSFGRAFPGFWPGFFVMSFLVLVAFALFIFPIKMACDAREEALSSSERSFHQAGSATAVAVAGERLLVSSSTTFSSDIPSSKVDAKVEHSLKNNGLPTFLPTIAFGEHTGLDLCPFVVAGGIGELHFLLFLVLGQYLHTVICNRCCQKMVKCNWDYLRTLQQLVLDELHSAVDSSPRIVAEVAVDKNSKLQRESRRPAVHNNFWGRLHPFQLDVEQAAAQYNAAIAPTSIFLSLSYLLMTALFIFLGTYYPTAEEAGLTTHEREWRAFIQVQIELFTPICTFWGVLAFFFGYQLARAQTSVAVEFAIAKRALFDADARVFPEVVRLWGDYDKFENWLDRHQCVAARAFGVPITPKLVQTIFASLGPSVCGIFLLLLKTMRKSL